SPAGQTVTGSAAKDQAVLLLLSQADDLLLADDFDWASGLEPGSAVLQEAVFSELEAEVSAASRKVSDPFEFRDDV
ncbi:MAG: hypothetical protein KDA37_08090, partial [Planctomycetales bacterium]|nr:hypothetical protein [Planctomycetales bacterium]